MTYQHWFQRCYQHDDCIMHVGEGETEIDGEIHQYRTESHAHSEIDPGMRLNLDYPEADDKRPGAKKGAKISWKLPDKAFVEREDTMMNEDQRYALAQAAIEKGLLQEHELLTHFPERRTV